jgi:DNA-binding NarL/FixJ family response regulator
MTQDKIRLLLVDDQKLFVESLQYVIESRAGDIEVVGIARDGREAVEFVADHRPDMILMDVRMPSMDGVEAMRVIHELHPDVRVLMLSTFEDDDLVREAIRHGAVGYLIKNMAPEELIDSVRAVMSGTMQIAPTAARSLLGGDVLPGGDSAREHAFALASLTRRERQVLGLIAAAQENREIARFLNVTEQTARNYVHNLYSKLGVSNRIQLMRIVRRIESEEGAS